MALSGHSRRRLSMSDIGGEADIPNARAVSAYDPKRTLRGFSAYRLSLRICATSTLPQLFVPTFGCRSIDMSA